MNDPLDVLASADQEQQRSAFDLATCRRAYVTAVELAEYLSVDRRTIARMAESLGGVRVGRAWRIPTDRAAEAFHVERKRAS